MPNQTLVIVPGMDGTGRLFDPLIAQLREQQWQVILVDHRDEDPWLSPKATLNHLSDRIETELDAAGVKRAIICGESFGSTAALTFAHRRPERVTALVILSGFAWLPFSLRRKALPVLYPLLTLIGTVIPVPVLRAVRRIWNPLVGKAERDVLRTAVRRMHVPSSRCILSKIRLAVGFDARPWLPEYKMPALIIAGARDRVIPPECANELAATIPGAVLIMIPNGGHLAHHALPQLLLKELNNLPCH